MSNFLFVLLSTALTAFSWGVYGPLMREGQAGMAGSHLLPFICVGLAYFLIAVLVPIVFLKWKPEPGTWTTTGIIWSFVAGIVTSVGALGIILALTNGGSPIYVMPLVFGGAPVVNTFMSMFMSRTYKQAGPIFYAGLILVIAGAVAVLVFNPARPRGSSVATAPAEKAPADKTAAQKSGAETTAAEPIATKDEPAVVQHESGMVKHWILVPLFIALTALCWGGYGPLLHKGQVAMAGSRLRPFICVGLAYFLVAVLVPIILRYVLGDHGHMSTTGVLFSLAAGAAGAIGSLGIILAFNFGGKPIYVMPLVFGGAPVINTLTSILTSKQPLTPSPEFYAGLIIVVAGAATVLIFAPKPSPRAKAAAKK